MYTYLFHSINISNIYQKVKSKKFFLENGSVIESQPQRINIDNRGVCNVKSKKIHIEETQRINIDT